MKKILFVCTGNIFRSPAAHAIAEHKAKELGMEKKYVFDSVGVHGYNTGLSPDRRSRKVGEEGGIAFEDITSKQITKSKHHEKIKLFLEFCEVENQCNDEVIDPYCKGENAFNEVFDLLDLALEPI